MAPEGDLFQHGELCLEGKPSAALRYSYIPGNTVDAALVLFVNGLVLPQTGWRQTMQDVVRFSDDAGQHHPALLSYDRFGQGVSDPDPADDGKVDGHTHDLNDVVRDLYDFLSQFSETRPASERSSKAHRQLILVCNSIGCPIARLFAQAHPGTVSGFIFLDSMVANVELFSVFPDPDSELFDGEHLPAGVTAEDVRHARQTYRRNFHSTLPNKERLNRANLARLLPNSDAPKLTTPGIEGPLLTVVGHDWNVFAAENKVETSCSPDFWRDSVLRSFHRKVSKFQKPCAMSLSILGGMGTIKDLSR